MRGQFIVTPPEGGKLILPNTLVSEGAEAYAATIFQAAALGTFYVGLCHQVPAKSDILASVVSEPTIGVNGYARASLARTAVGWPTIGTVNDETYILSDTVDFVASGGTFDAQHSRLFICSVASGVAGTLFAYSAALPYARDVQDGETWSAQYQFFMN